MRKSVLLASLTAAVALAACGKKEEPAPASPPARPNPNIRDLEQSLARHFGTAVQLKDKKNGAGGSIVITYGSYDELDRLLAQMRG